MLTGECKFLFNCVQNTCVIQIEHKHLRWIKYSNLQLQRALTIIALLQTPPTFSSKAHNADKLLHYFIIDCTLPTLPSVSRTLIPWGWVEVLVRMSLTIPSVNIPLCWCCFKTIFTRMPGLIWLLCWLGCISSYTCFVAYSAFALRIQKVRVGIKIYTGYINSRWKSVF